MMVDILGQMISGYFSIDAQADIIGEMVRWIF
jgi:hypothetical protein